MNAIVKSICQDCGDVEVDSRHVGVRICVDDGCATYTFRCPSCGLPVVRPADDRAVQLLLEAGSALTRWSLPAELFEAHHGPAVDHDDLLAFHSLLQGDGWFDAVCALVGPERNG